MNNKAQEINFSRTAELLIGIFSVLISILLILLCVTILTKCNWSIQTQAKDGITLFSYPATFAIFFSVIAINLLKPRKNKFNTELMSLIGWKLLAGIMFGFGLIIFIYGNWIGVILPFVIGALSLLKDPKIRELYQLLFGL